VPEKTSGKANLLTDMLAKSSPLRKLTAAATLQNIARTCICSLWTSLTTPKAMNNASEANRTRSTESLWPVPPGSSITRASQIFELWQLLPIEPTSTCTSSASLRWRTFHDSRNLPSIMLLVPAPQETTLPLQRRLRSGRPRASLLKSACVVRRSVEDFSGK